MKLTCAQINLKDDLFVAKISYKIFWANWNYFFPLKCIFFGSKKNFSLPIYRRFVKKNQGIIISQILPFGKSQIYLYFWYTNNVKHPIRSFWVDFFIHRSKSISFSVSGMARHISINMAFVQ